MYMYMHSYVAYALGIGSNYTRLLHMCRVRVKWQRLLCTTTGPQNVTKHWQSAAMTGGLCLQ